MRSLSKSDHSWRRDAAVDRVMARVRFGIAMTLAAVIFGVVFAHTLGVAMAPLLAAVQAAGVSK